MSMLMRVRFENNGRKFMRRCDLCHRARFELYRIRFEEGQPLYWLCPGMCVAQAQKNWKEKREKQLLPPAQEEGSGFTNEIMETSNEDNIEEHE